MHPQAVSDPTPAFTVATLAARWQCGQSTVRKLIADGDLKAFRIGTAIRISAEEVGRYECQNIRCSDSAADTPLSGPKTPENPSIPPETEAEGRYTPKIARARKRKPAGSGKGATILPGPWAGS
jgi:excisionase family DNA binding protein